MKTNIGISEQDRKKIVNQLSVILANEYVLITKTKNAHWNITSPDFMEKHLFLEGQFKQLDKFIDQVAERIRMLGFPSPGKLQTFLNLSQLKEMTGELHESKDFIKELLNDHETVIVEMRKDVDLMGEELKDAGTADFVTGLMEEHEKMAWFLRSHL